MKLPWLHLSFSAFPFSPPSSDCFSFSLSLSLFRSVFRVIFLFSLLFFPKGGRKKIDCGNIKPLNCSFSTSTASTTTYLNHLQLLLCLYAYPLYYFLCLYKSFSCKTKTNFFSSFLREKVKLGVAVNKNRANAATRLVVATEPQLASIEGGQTDRLTRITTSNYV